MKKKGLFSSMIVLSSVLLLAACGNGEDSGNQGTGNGGNSDDEAVEEQYADFINIDEDGNGVPDWQEEEMELNIAISHYGEIDEENTMWLNIEKFAEKYDNITVVRDRQFAGDGGDEIDDFDRLEMLNAKAQEGNLPDLFYSPLSAEAYDREFTLDLTPYVETDEESEWISDNAREFMQSYDGEQIYGIPWQSVSRYAIINTQLLRENNIDIPGYDWTYEDYEDLRSQIAVLTPNNPIFPGIIDFSEIGPHYFDGIPNGWKGYNIETDQWDLASATGYGDWLEQFAREGLEGLHFYDLSDEEREAKVGNLGWAFGDGLQVIDSAWLYALSGDVNEFIETRGMEVDIYPLPEAPEGGETHMQAYYDTLSLSSQLADDPVKAEAAFALLKWLTYGEEGLLSRWALIDEYTGLDEDASLKAEDRLMDFVQGWPATTNPAVLEQHPLVQGFPEDSELANYNFAAFQEEHFQQQLSNPIAYPRHMPAFSNVQGEIDNWEIMHQVRDEGVRYSDIAPEWDREMNGLLEEYQRQYSR